MEYQKAKKKKNEKNPNSKPQILRFNDALCWRGRKRVGKLNHRCLWSGLQSRSYLCLPALMMLSTHLEQRLSIYQKPRKKNLGIKKNSEDLYQRVNSFSI